MIGIRSRLVGVTLGTTVGVVMACAGAAAHGASIASLNGSIDGHWTTQAFNDGAYGGSPIPLHDNDAAGGLFYDQTDLGGDPEEEQGAGNTRALAQHIFNNLGNTTVAGGSNPGGSASLSNIGEPVKFAGMFEYTFTNDDVSGFNTNPFAPECHELTP